MGFVTASSCITAVNFPRLAQKLIVAIVNEVLIVGEYKQISLAASGQGFLMHSDIDHDATKSIRRIRNLIIISLFAAFGTLLAARVTGLWIERNEIIQTASQHSNNRAILVREIFSRTVESIDRELLRISLFAADLKPENNSPTLTVLLQQSLQSLRGVGSLTILDDKGTITHSTLSQIIGENRADRPLLRALLADNTTDFVADAPIASRITSLTLIPFGRRIVSSQGAFGGAVVATLEFERVREMFRSLDVGKNGIIWIVHPDGHVLLRLPSEQMGMLPADHPLLSLPAVSGSQHSHVGPLSPGGENFITSIQQMGIPSVRIAVSLNETEVLSRWTGSAIRSSVALSLGFAAILLVSLLVNRLFSARLHAAEKYISQARRFRDILDYAPVTVTVKDRAGRISYANKEFLRRVGKSLRNVVGKKLHDLLPARYADELTAIDDKVMETGEVVQNDVKSDEPRIYLSTKFPLLDSDQKVEGVGSISLDISESKAMQTINFRIFEKSIDLILVTDSRGNLIRVSPSVTAILGYLPSEVEGRNASDFIYSEDLESTRNEMRLARRGEISRDFISRYHHKNGRVVELSWTGMWVEEERQHFFIGHDMTERVKLEQELRHSQKMEAIGRLTGGLAHDYNNLLTVILGNAELLSEMLQDQPRLLPLAKATLDAADRSAVLTQRLLAFGRRQALSAEVTDVNILVSEMMNLITVTSGEQIRVALDLTENPWTIKIDRGQLETAILNLIVNARDAIGTSGTIRIETAKVSFDDEVASVDPSVRSGNFLMLAISDNGCGMDSETLNRVFEPFFTTKATGKGTGLGLSMVYGFVKQSGGHVSIYSEPGVGTSVKLFFPPAAGGAVMRLDEDNEYDFPAGTETILLVEDEPSVRENTERQLSLLGYKVYSAANGAEALALFHEARPNLLLTDVVMAGEMNGRDLARTLLKEDPELRILFMSGYTSGVLSDSDGSMPEGMNFIGKPFRRVQLSRAVRTVLDAKKAESV